MLQKAMTLVVILVCAAASASSMDLMDTTMGKIDSAYARGEIDYDHAVTYKYLAMTTGASKYVPSNFLSSYYAPEPISGTSAITELRLAWPYLDADCKDMVSDFHGWGPGESWENTTWRTTYWGTTFYDGVPVQTYDHEDGFFRIHYVTDGPNAVEPDNDHADNPSGLPDVVYFNGEWYDEGFDIYTDLDYYIFPEHADFFPLRDYYADIEGSEWPEGDVDYGGDDRFDVYLGVLPNNVGGATYGGRAFTFVPWPAYASYMVMPPYYDDYLTEDFNTRETAYHEFFHHAHNMFNITQQTAGEDESWYKEASTMYHEMVCYPGPNPWGYLRDTLNRNYVNRADQSIDDLGDGGYSCSIINFFFEEWSERDWVAPNWDPPTDVPTDYVPLGDPAYAMLNETVMDIWRASAVPGDPFFTGDDNVNRDLWQTFDFLVREHYIAGTFPADLGAWRYAWHTFAEWAWFIGSDRDDGRWKYGSDYPTDVNVAEDYATGDYPVVDEDFGDDLNRWSFSYNEFADLNTDSTVAGWNNAVLTYSPNPEESYDDNTKHWLGSVYASTDGTNWKSLSDIAGEPTQMLYRFGGDKGIIKISNPSQYHTIAMDLTHASDYGVEIEPIINFRGTDDNTAPVLSVVATRPNVNPDYIEVLIGADDVLFDVPKVMADMAYTGTDATNESEPVMLISNGSNGYAGTFVMPVGATGSGVISYAGADVNGNVASGSIPINVTYMLPGGGVAGDDSALLRVPARALDTPTFISIVSMDDFIKPDTSSLTANSNGAVTKNETEVFGSAYDIGPNWANLNESAFVSLNYNGDVDREDYLSVFRYTNSGWVDMGGTIDKRHNRVTVATDELGIFALGYGEYKESSAGSPFLPKTYALSQCYPNPASSFTKVNFALPESAHVTLKVYDLKGRVVNVVANEDMDAGEYTREISTDNLSSGVYIYRLETENYNSAKKMVISR